MSKIVFDIETANIFFDVGVRDPAALELAVIAIYDYDRDVYEHYLLEDLPKLWPILEKADLLIGFNSDHFDIPLLGKYYLGDLGNVRSLDILAEIKKSYGRRMRLDQIAEGTLGTNKITNGLEATRWWKEGKKDKVIEYCLHDVKITKEVYDYALANQKLIFKEDGKLNVIPLNTSGWEARDQSLLTHTLPF